MKQIQSRNKIVEGQFLSLCWKYANEEELEDDMYLLLGM